MLSTSTPPRGFRQCARTTASPCRRPGGRPYNRPHAQPPGHSCPHVRPGVQFGVSSVYEPAIEAPTRPKQKSFLRDLAEVVVLALVLYVLIQFAVQTIHVMGPSMENTLQNND